MRMIPPTPPTSASRFRLVGALVPGPLALVVLGGVAWLHYRTAQSGITGWLAEAFKYKPIHDFAVFYGLKILLPVYALAGILAWLLTLAPMCWLDRTFMREWRGREAIGFGISALAFSHLVLWWEVPTALWVIPGLRGIPFVALFPLLAAMALAYPCFWLTRRRLTWVRRGLLLACWLVLWSLPAKFPSWIEPPKPAARPGQGSAKVLMIGLDGLRSDVFLEHAPKLKGIPYSQATTPIPATRLLWHVLWGGDPLFYSVGHVGPSIEEFENPNALKLLAQAKAQGWRPRFYIDDGGTIGLAQREVPLDDYLMPAEGWENFVNSNLAASFPLYAVWEKWIKPFPTTNPWTALDAGLKETLRLGRGSQWVMYHSCLAHQPIFLTRQELKSTGRWWALSPRRYLPFASRFQVSPAALQESDPRTAPFLAYRIRMASILAAWEPIWNALPQDPNYAGAVRVLFSDHGERFHHVADGFQLQGIHGFNLDPWELKVALHIAGPGFSDALGEPPQSATVSLLGIRDGIHGIMQGQPFKAGIFEAAYPVAPSRYHVVDRSNYTVEPGDYRQISEKEIASDSYIGPHGLWFTKYDRPANQRAADASVAWMEGAELTVLKPLKNGGAHQFRYRNYDLIGFKDVGQDTMDQGLKRIEMLMATQP